uniref:Uncharacterized protein n=1 Tax=Rhizophora mucronata TaxID=61149 RepID=A0A2P2P2C3_RHIMU
MYKCETSSLPQTYLSPSNEDGLSQQIREDMSLEWRGFLIKFLSKFIFNRIYLFSLLVSSFNFGIIFIYALTFVALNAQEGSLSYVLGCFL